jgi:tRNA(Ile)-lysidine synthase
LKAVVDEKMEQEADGKNEVLFDAAAVRFPLKIRPRFEGDFFYPAGFGKRKKLQDFFVDEKVPRDERDRVPIVLSENDIIWVAGYRADERFKVTGKTENILRLIISKIKS